jgi:glycosyltransferase involved in cell wall biosynthesis
MRVLVLHSRYLSGPTSGENRVVEDEVRLLREAGHDVTAWMPSLAANPRAVELAAAGLRTVWSRQAAARVRSILREKRIDVMHVHNLFPSLSPSVFRAAHEEGVRVVATLHNYRLLCLPATLLRDGRICEDCVGRVPWPGVLHRCYRSSSGASAALATSLALHRALGTFHSVVLYLAVSEFVRQKHIDGGILPGRIKVKPNFAWPARRRHGPGRYFLYLGRLSPEKGLEVLLRAWGDVDAPLLIAGDGPDRDRLESSAPDHVRFLGTISPARAEEVVQGARALILPSTSYEGAPRSIAEAYAAGVPVIASRLGGLPELVREGTSGVLVPPGDPGALREAAIGLLSEAASLQLGEGAHRLWLEALTPERGLRALEEAYTSAGNAPRPDAGREA